MKQKSLYRSFWALILFLFIGTASMAQCAGGTVSSTKGLSFGVCANSANAIFDVSHTTTAMSASYTYIVTDDSDNVLAYMNSSTIDLSGAGTGICKVWGMSFTGTLNMPTGVPVSTVTSTACSDLSSNALTVYRELPDGGTVTTASGDTLGVCAGSNNAIFEASFTTAATNLSYWYIITDNNDNILDWVNSANSDTLDLSGAPVGECHIWGWSYRGLPDPVVGNHINTLADDPCEEISTNYVTVFREVPNGGTVATSSGDTTRGVCANSPNAIFDVMHTNTATHLSYWYVITDNNDDILAWMNSANGNTLDLSGAPPGECHIWGWSYRGLPPPEVGNNISTLNDDDCEEISSNFIRVYREVPDGGTVDSDQGTNVTIIAGDGTPDPIIVSHVTNATNLSYWYIITDNNDDILTWTTSDTIDLEGAGAGECHIWGWSYRGLPDPIVGNNISTLDDDDCEAISSNWITVNRWATGIDDVFAGTSIKVYPNPATDFIRIESETPLTVQLLDLQGRLIQTTTTQVMDVKSQKTGVYLLKVIEGENVYFSRFVID